MSLKIQNSFDMLKMYCEQKSYKGYDPYDGLNSKVFKILKMENVKFFRLAWIQLFKRNPLNFRKIFLIAEEYNPKGLGLFLTGYCNLYHINKNKQYLEQIIFLADMLIELQTVGYSGSCWGYNFDWQSRAFFLKKGTPTVVATAFISYALLDAYDITKNKNYLNCAISSAEFIINDLNRTQKQDGFIFSYSPYDSTRVYNASLLGSKLLSRIFSYTNDKNLLDIARQSIVACVNEQRDDGAWVYGELKTQGWVDSFHTGYNIEAIYEYQKYSHDNSFNTAIEKAMHYYLNNFFLEDGTPKYYDNKVYPIDIHAPAQFLSTLYRLGILEKNIKLVDKVLNWTIENMQDGKGYFYYQMKPFISSKIPYMRWAQAWMFYSFTFYLKKDISCEDNLGIVKPTV